MRRLIIFRDTETGEEIVMPVTPSGYDVLHGRKVTAVTMHGAGEVNLPGELALLNTTLDFLLPAQDYPFSNEGAVTNPFEYVEKFSRWSDNGTVLRFIVSGTPVNGAVILDPVTYRVKEGDGSGDLYLTVPMRGYRSLEAPTTQRTDTGNAARSVEALPAAQNTYTVVAGDTLGGICRKFYGNANLYGKLATVNGIKNPNLIYPGQVLQIPDISQLDATQATPLPKSAQVAAQTEVFMKNGKMSVRTSYEPPRTGMTREGGEVFQ